MKRENIPINEKLLNKYESVNEIFIQENKRKHKSIKLELMNISCSNMNANTIYHLAINIFKSNHIINEFLNNGNIIKVTNQDIKESVNKFYNDRLQNIYLKEHLTIFSKLGNIIHNSVLVNQTFETKGRKRFITWNYYYSGIIINNQKYNLEFDVVSRTDGENHYRVQRIEKAEIQSTLLN